MSRKSAAERDPIARHARSLPSAPSLEYERKEAKALLKQIRAGDEHALERVRSVHPVSLRDRRPDQLKLADAQHVLAREYGFASWPRLVDYFEEMERHRSAPRFNSSDDGFGHFEQRAQGVIRGISAATEWLHVSSRTSCLASTRGRSPKFWPRRLRKMKHAWS
jgi:hypothetical protein